MSLKSVNDILGVVEAQVKSQEEPFQLLLKFWPETVGAVVAAHTQLISIQREVLWVATSSAAWAQNLTFQRLPLLLKLNKQLPTPLLDIRFSSAGWKRLKNTANQQQTVLLHEHPSYVGEEMSVPRDVTLTNTENANAAFEDWAKVMQARSHGLPLCPQCNCPTPPGELQRWGVCCLCAVKQDF